MSLTVTFPAYRRQRWDLLNIRVPATQLDLVTRNIIIKLKVTISAYTAKIGLVRQNQKD